MDIQANEVRPVPGWHRASLWSEPGSAQTRTLVKEKRKSGSVVAVWLSGEARFKIGRNYQPLNTLSPNGADR